MRATRILVLLFGAFLFTQVNAQEICNNGFDDDGNGLADLNDVAQCPCVQSQDTLTVPSVIPNPSFEQTNCCPNGISQLNCAQTWVQATTPTTDYFNSCNYFPPIMPMPLPDGNAAVGTFVVDGWQEYIGACLPTPLTGGTSYTLSMQVAASAVDGSVMSNSAIFFPPFDIVIYGLPNCVPLPISTTGCPTGNGWIELGSVTYTPTFAWNTVTITFSYPVDIATIMIGSQCNLDPAAFAWIGGFGPYLFWDALNLNQSSFFNSSNITSIGSICDGDLTLIASPDTILPAYQWFYEGYSITGAIDTILEAAGVYGFGEGTYQFVMGDPGGAFCNYSQITIQPPTYPAVDFIPSATNGCAPFTVTFNNITTPPAAIGTCFWDFGDGTTSTDPSPQHTYLNPGVYTVQLTVYSPDNCFGNAYYQDLITVGASPTASFTLDTLAGCGPLTVGFTNTSLPGTFVSCAWSIGTGPALGTCDFSYTYTVPGTYPVSLVVTAANGCPSIPAGPVNVTVYPDPNTQFTSNVVSGCEPLTVQFQNTTNPALIGTCDWDLGNGTLTTDCAPSGYYPTPGQYGVSLTVVSPQGCTASITMPMYVTVYPIPEPIIMAVPDSGCYPLEVQFTNLTDPATVNTCSWSFGNGATSLQCDPTYIYQDPGIYDVTLTVVSPQGCAGDTTMPALIEVFDHPVAAFTMSPQPTDIYQAEIQFTDGSTPDVVLWDWDFGFMGGLGNSDEQNPLFQFPDQNPGQYPVTLIVTNYHGCKDTVESVVYINPYFTVYVPNTFTPDGDGVNDYFFPYIVDDDMTAYKLYIFDRWGGKVFESTDRWNVWNGGYMNSGEILPQGVYVWRLISAAEQDRVRKEYMGHVTLLK
ncbi:MAG: PKD domain-containing protein [Flavobacteriales bacterium]|nr:PKD domain-containing protein [Flavobacteriales bacterium]